MSIRIPSAKRELGEDLGQGTLPSPGLSSVAFPARAGEQGCAYSGSVDSRWAPVCILVTPKGPKGLSDVAQSRTFRKRKLGGPWGKGASEPSFIRKLVGLLFRGSHPAERHMHPRSQSLAAEKPNGMIRLTSSMKGQGHPVRAGT